MKKGQIKKPTKASDFPRNFQLNIKPAQNARTRIRQLLCSFIPLHPYEETEEFDSCYPEQGMVNKVINKQFLTINRCSN